MFSVKKPTQHVLALAILTLITYTGEAQSVSAPRKLTLDQAIRLALETQPQLKIAASRLAGAKARLIETASSYYPQLAPSLDYTSSRNSYRVGGLTSTTVNERSEASLGLRQLVYDMGRREAQVAASKASVEASDFSLRNTRQTVILNVTTAYYELLRRRELLRVQETAVERAKATYDATKAYAEAGTVRQIDVLQAEADYKNALVQLSVATNDVRLAEASLRNAIGLDTRETVTASDETPSAPADNTAAETLDSLVAKAFDNRPDLKSELALLNADRASARIARINAGPVVEASITAGYRFDPDPGSNNVLMAALSFPLFDGGASRARVRQAEENLRQSQQQIALARQEIHLAVEEAYLSREEARQRLTAARSAAAAARANYEAATAGYQEGVQTIVDVITARAQLVTAETNVVQSLYDYHTAQARLLRAVGDNDPYWTGGKR